MSILKEFDIISTRIKELGHGNKTPWITKWVLHTVKVPGSKAKELAMKISPLLIDKVWYQNTWHRDNWYADWRNDTHHYIIFPQRIFYVDRHKKAEYEEVMRYGISIGILAEQVNFVEDVI